jgi:hypothetical protein
MKVLLWQMRTIALIALAAPPAASLILMLYSWQRTEPFDLFGFAASFLLFGVPVGYAFGIVPALLASALYCVSLTLISTLQRRTGVRVCVGAACGWFASEVWFREVMHVPSHAYGWVAALVAATLSVWLPAPISELIVLK